MADSDLSRVEQIEQRLRAVERLDDDASYALNINAPSDLAWCCETIRRLTAELSYWKTCANCGQQMDAPGLCSVAQHEWQKASNEMLEQAWNDRDSYKAQLAEAVQAREKAQDWAELVARGQSPCGHWKCYAHTEDGGKHIYCYACELAASDAAREADRRKLEYAIRIAKALGASQILKALEGEPS